LPDLIAENLREDLLRVFEDPTYAPPMLPAVALEVLALTTRPEPDVNEIVALLERDQMIALYVLRLAGSALYARRAPIRTLHDAVTRLGAYAVRDAVFEVALRKGMLSRGEYGQTVATIARHSTLTAYITRIVCRHARIDSQLAFLGGLLHDVGFAALLLAVEHVEGPGAPKVAALWPHVDALHERASLLLAKRWMLPNELVEIIGYHHHLHTSAMSPVAAAVQIADQLTEYVGGSVLGPGPSGEPVPGDVVGEFDLEANLAALRIDDAGLARIRAEAERTVPEIALL
jgi:putative nucleotidyltransferase with HDIG domain